MSMIDIVGKERASGISATLSELREIDATYTANLWAVRRARLDKCGSGDGEFNYPLALALLPAWSWPGGAGDLEQRPMSGVRLIRATSSQPWTRLHVLAQRKPTPRSFAWPGHDSWLSFAPSSSADGGSDVTRQKLE